MNEKREREIERLRGMFESGEVYEALRDSLALRPPARELIAALQRPPLDSAVMARLLRPSRQASDPNRPVGAAAAAIRLALPEFVEWTHEVGEAPWPPGFAEGRAGAYLRTARALVMADSGSVYQQLRDSVDAESFTAAMEDARLSDVLELTWMTEGPLELRAVQQLLERIASNLLPEKPVRFLPHDGPRYRAALQMEIVGVAARAACGGVLAEWPGQRKGNGAAQVRIFLEPWATALSGKAIQTAPARNFL
jgi:hypothetical protein